MISSKIQLKERFSYIEVSLSADLVHCSDEEFDFIFELFKTLRAYEKEKESARVPD